MKFIYCGSLTSFKFPKISFLLFQAVQGPVLEGGLRQRPRHPVLRGGLLHGDLLRAREGPPQPEQPGQPPRQRAPAPGALRGGPVKAGGHVLPGHPRADGRGQQGADGGGHQHERDFESVARRVHHHIHAAQARPGIGAHRRKGEWRFQDSKLFLSVLSVS